MPVRTAQTPSRRALVVIQYSFRARRCCRNDFDVEMPSELLPIGVARPEPRARSANALPELRSDLFRCPQQHLALACRRVAQGRVEKDYRPLAKEAKADYFGNCFGGYRLCGEWSAIAGSQSERFGISSPPDCTEAERCA